MEVNALQLVFKFVLLGKMTYAVSAWWSYTTAADKQRLEALICRAVRVGLYPADGPNLHQLVADMNDALFARIQANEQHILQQLLPAHTCYKYVLRSRRHDYTLSIKTDYDYRNFITRLLYKDMYWLFFSLAISLLFDILSFDNFLLNEDDDDDAKQK